jgi:hypothetical protein
MALAGLQQRFGRRIHVVQAMVVVKHHDGRGQVVEQAGIEALNIHSGE